MTTRRDFLRSAAALTGGALLPGSVPAAIARAMAIDPAAGSTFLDAEHIVILMQENRSFDHCFGALQGVRGFRDSRAHTLPNGNPVWFQTSPKGETYAPFRLNMRETNVTWIGGLPHSWRDQVDARNEGRYDRWLHAKPRKELPFTLGYYQREDLPFYYALADAFTVCDAAFCSSLTGTTPNRLYLWSGTIRQDAQDPARVQNGDCDYGKEANWTTTPERLEDAGISWRIYQNELSLDSGLHGDADSWLANFTDNPIEWFSQYRVRFSPTHRAHLDEEMKTIPAEIAKREEMARLGDLTEEGAAKLKKDLADLHGRLDRATATRAQYTEAAWNALSPRERSLHERAFSTNVGDPAYRELETLTYESDGKTRETKAPKGDTFHRFREDVRSGNLPAVSWLVAPENFSDHPSSGWYGAWYVSEAMNILTEDPEVWRKTIFILCYDENDGYFDHVPPFVAPFPGRPETGRCSEGIDTAVDVSDAHGRTSPIGLGYRCPLVIASPWSRGGAVNSQVFDHTSVLRLIEEWSAHKGKPVREENISDWRRTVCGDLTSVFRPWDGKAMPLPARLDRDATIRAIHASQDKPMPKGDAALDSEGIRTADVGRAQEPGTRPSSPLPYELAVDGAVVGDRLRVRMAAGNRRFGRKAQGAPYLAYVYGSTEREELSVRSYAVRAGDAIEDEFPISGPYHVRIDGPNGFMREFIGATDAPALQVTVTEEGTRLVLKVANSGPAPVRVAVRDASYGGKPQSATIPAGKMATLAIETRAHGGWYDAVVGAGSLSYRYAGRIETGRPTITDPAMGGTLAS